LTCLRTRAGDLQVAGLNLAIGTVTRVRVRAEDVLIATAAPTQLSALNVFRGAIVALKPVDSSTMDVTVDCSGQPLHARVTRRSVEQLALKEGLPIHAIIKSVALDPVWIGSFKRLGDV